MNEKFNQKNKVWQDIKFSKPKKTASEKVTESQLIKFAVKLLFKKAKNRLTFAKRRYIISAVMIFTVLVGSTAYFFFIYYPAVKRNTNLETTDTGRPILQKSTPNYSTIVPKDKKISDLGGWTRISPPTSDPVHAFSDKIDGKSIIISQQPLPEEFKKDTEKKIEELSQSFNASQKITVGSRTIHIGTSSDGPQSVIFSENEILVLIKSESVINNDQWIQYISSLK